MTPGDRSLFPDLAPSAYLAHCAIAPVSAPVRAAVDEVTASYARHGVGALGRWLEQRAALRASVATLIGARPDDIGFVANTTTGVVDVAYSLDWRPGDRIVLFDGEFPTNVTPWRRAAATFGLEIARVPLTGDVLGALETELRRGARLVAVSAVQFQTGLAMPLAGIGALCREYGAELFVDAIQALGAMPLDVGALGIDYLTCGSHKWLMGIEGCALVYVAPSRAGALVPRLAGWLSHEDPVGFLMGGSLTYDRGFRARADVFEVGAANVAGLAALGAAVDVILAVGVDRVFAHVQAWHDAIEGAMVARGFRSARAPHREGRSGILAFRPPEGIAAASLVAPLGARGVVVSAPDGHLRLAPSWPNALDEVPRVLAALDEVMRGYRSTSQ